MTERPGAEYYQAECIYVSGIIWLGLEWCAASPADGSTLLAQAGYWGVLADPPALLARRLAERA